ncbi:RnfABCDGE type electron transport complex subunit G [Candidatus Omnitrophota bacterium]
MTENVKHVLTLSIICLVTATLLTGVYVLTNPKIVEQKAQQASLALRQVMPEAGYFEPVSLNGEAGYFKAYASANKKKLLGYAFRAQAQGYSSVIETMAGIDRAGKITGIVVLAQNETPGLGARIEEVLVTQTLWQKIKEMFSSKQGPQPSTTQPWFCQQFVGQDIDDLTVDAISGATISSAALTDSVRQRAQQILEENER